MKREWTLQLSVISTGITWLTTTPQSPSSLVPPIPWLLPMGSTQPEPARSPLGEKTNVMQTINYWWNGSYSWMPSTDWHLQDVHMGTPQKTGAYLDYDEQSLLVFEFIIRHSNNDTYFVNLNIGTYFCYLYNNFQSIMADHFWIRIHSVNLNIGTYFCYLTHTKTSSSQIWSQMTTAHYLPLFPLLFLIAVHTFHPFYLKRNTWWR